MSSNWVYRASDRTSRVTQRNFALKKIIWTKSNGMVIIKGAFVMSCLPIYYTERIISFKTT